MGATSLLNVTGLVLSGLALFSAALAANTKRHRRLPLHASIATSLDRNFRLDVRPAAMIAEISGKFAGTVVYHGLDNVLARFAESRLRNRFAVDDCPFCRIERNRARTSILGPNNGHADWFSASLRQSVVGRGNAESRRV